MREQAMREFLDSNKYAYQTRQQYQSLFADMEAYEQAHNLDFREPTETDVISFLNSQCYSDYHAAQSGLQMVKQYIAIAGNKAKVQNLHADQVDLTKGIQQRLVSSIEHAYRLLSLVAQPNTGSYLFPACTFAWLGVERNSSVRILKEQVDLDSGMIKSVQGLLYPRMDEQMIYVMQEYRNTQPQKGNHRKFLIPDMNERPEFMFKMLERNSEYRGSRIEPSEVSRKFQDVKKVCLKYKLQPQNLGYHSLIRSSKFAKLYKMEQDGVN